MLQVLMFVVVLGGGSTEAGNVIASSAHLNLLANGEETLLLRLTDYLEAERVRLASIDRLIGEINEEQKYEGKYEGAESTLIYNPLNVLHLIKRFVTTWDSIFKLVSDNSSSTALENEKKLMETHIPTADDYNGAKFSLLRLQKAYELPIEDLISGHIAGHLAQPLSQQTTVEIALHALERQDTEAAIDWLNQALNHTVPPLTTKPEIYHALGRTYAHKGDFLIALEYIQKALLLDPSNPEYLRDIVPPPGEREEIFPSNEYLMHFYELCRKAVKNTAVSQSQSAQLNCVLKRSKSVPYQRYKVEYFSRSPEVLLYHEFTTDSETKQLLEFTVNSSLMAPAYVGTGSHNGQVRLGKVAWLADHIADIVDDINLRISDATGLNITMQSAEALQMSNYGVGGHFVPHTDNFGKVPETLPYFGVPFIGDRMATFMMYFNDVEAGGATAFLKLNLTVQPIKNSGLFWYNYKRSGDAESLSEHAGCPILYGEKWVGNKWIREFGQEFAWPCALERDA